jgi:hypothetical protein
MPESLLFFLDFLPMLAYCLLPIVCCLLRTDPGHAVCITLIKEKMEKRVIGIVLTFLGIAGLILGAVNFMQSGGGTRNVKEIIIYFILGAIFFFAGISLIRTTHDRPS